MTLPNRPTFHDTDTAGARIRVYGRDHFCPDVAKYNAYRWDLDPRVLRACTYLSHDELLAILPVLALEMPHEAETQAGRLAYVREASHWDADRQTVTSVGKYIARVFKRADGSAYFTAREVELLGQAPVSTTTFKLLDDMDEMIAAIRAVPSGSCMGGRKFADTPTHPMRCYDPAFGWRLAVRYEAGEAQGRALVRQENETDAHWVRSYCHAGDDRALEAWMGDQGISRRSGWQGAKLARIEADGGLVAPYLDGRCRSVDVRRDCLVVDEDGDALADQTDGFLNDHSGQVQLDNGDWVDEEDAVEMDGRMVHVDETTWDDVNDEWIWSEDATEARVRTARGAWTTRTTHQNNVVGGWDGYCYLHEDCVGLTHGPHAGEWAHESQTRTYDGGSAVVLAEELPGARYCRGSETVRVRRALSAASRAIRAKLGERLAAHEEAQRLRELEAAHEEALVWNVVWPTLRPGGYYRISERIPATAARGVVVRADHIQRGPRGGFDIVFVDPDTPNSETSTGLYEWIAGIAGCLAHPYYFIPLETEIAYA